MFPKLTSIEEALTLLFAFVWHFSLKWCETAQDFNRPKFPDEECRSDIEDMFELINLAPEPLSDFLSLGGVWFPIEGRAEWFSTTEWLGEWWHASGWEQFFFTILQFSRPPPIKETLNLNRLFRLWLKDDIEKKMWDFLVNFRYGLDRSLLLFQYLYIIWLTN